MSDKILMFPRKKKIDIHDVEISECLNAIVDLTQSRGGVLLLLKQNEDSAVAWSGELNTQEMMRLCCLGIHDAYTLEVQEEEDI